MRPRDIPTTMLLTLAILLFSGIAAAGQQNQQQQPQADKPAATEYQTSEHVLWQPKEGEWTDVPVFDPGARMKVIHGDPATGPADLLVMFPAGYGVPWHFHTPVETVYMQSGRLVIDVRQTGESVTLEGGGYFLAPSKHVHRARCTSQEECLFFLKSDGPFDVNIVNEQGQVIRSGP